MKTFIVRNHRGVRYQLTANTYRSALTHALDFVSQHMLDKFNTHSIKNGLNPISGPFLRVDVRREFDNNWYLKERGVQMARVETVNGGWQVYVKDGPTNQERRV